MKAIKCELCGSNDMIKDGDFFVCQSCGMKYTAENAKKMMVDGTVQVQGTVSIDDEDKKNNLLSLAKKACKANNSEEAERYANRVLEIDPKNWEAFFIKGEAVGWQTSIQNNRINEAIEYYAESLANCTKAVSAKLKKDISDSISEMSLAMIKLRCKNFIAMPSEANGMAIINEADNSLVRCIKLLLKCGVSADKFKSAAAIAMNNAATSGWKKILKDYTQGKPLQPVSPGESRMCRPGDWDIYAHPSANDAERLLGRGDICIKLLKAAIALDNNDDKDDLIRYDNLIGIQQKLIETVAIRYMPGGPYTNAEWACVGLTSENEAERWAEIDKYREGKARTQLYIEMTKKDKGWKKHPKDKLKELEQMLQDVQERHDNDTELRNDEKDLEKLKGELSQCGMLDMRKKKELKRMIGEQEKRVTEKRAIYSDEAYILQTQIDAVTHMLKKSK